MAQVMSIVNVDVDETVEKILQLYPSLDKPLQEHYAVHLYYLAERMKWDASNDLDWIDE